MVNGEPINLVEIHGFLAIDGEEWEGVAWWPEPTDPKLWPQFAADVAVAFSVSAGQHFAPWSQAVKFKAGGERTTVYPPAMTSVLRYLNKHKPDAPERVSWRPIVMVRIVLEGESNG